MVQNNKDLYLFESFAGTLLMTPERRRAIWAIYGKNLCFYEKSFNQFVLVSSNQGLNTIRFIISTCFSGCQSIIDC